MTSVIHRDLAARPPMLSHGENVYLIDTDGKRYIDGSSGAAVSCLGHSHAGVTAALREQLDAVPYAHTGFFTTAPAETLAEELIQRAPPGFGDGRVGFFSSGSEAMEAALKLARQHFVEKGEPQRDRFIARRMSFHGNTLGALSIGHHVARRETYAPLLVDMSHVSPCFPYRFREAGETDEQYGERLCSELEAEFQRLGPDRVAAFVSETIVGATTGCVEPVPGYFRGIREICDRHGALLIVDEVMCGMGRTGHWFAIAQEETTPDLITIAKGLGAGYQPISAVLAAEPVMAPMITGSQALMHSHTYMSHATAAAGGVAVIRAIEEEGLLENVRHMGEVLRTALVGRFGNHAHIGDIRGRGLFMALEFVRDRTSKEPFPRSAAIAERLKAHAMEAGLLCYPTSGTADGTAGDHVLLAPPYIVTENHIGEIVDKLEKAIDACLTERTA